MVVGLCEESVSAASSCGRNRPAFNSPADAVSFPPLWPAGSKLPGAVHPRSHLRFGPNRALCDLPQIILAAYFLSQSFGDCLPEEGDPVPGACTLKANSALMIVLSLATSSAYFGCTHASYQTSAANLHSETSRGNCHSKLVCRQSRANPTHRRALARDERARRPSPVVRPGRQCE
jgi:hypothetical protein